MTNDEWRQLAKAMFRVLLLIAASHIAYDVHRMADHFGMFSPTAEARLTVRKPDDEVITHMPDSTLTSGKWDEKLTLEDICARGSASDRRKVSESLKQQVYKRYGITNHKPGEYEIDHLVSLELGGTNDIENLWPQRYETKEGEWGAHKKDRLENKLHQMICKGDITPEDAREEIRTDWVEAYQKYISN